MQNVFFIHNSLTPSLLHMSRFCCFQNLVLFTDCDGGVASGGGARLWCCLCRMFISLNLRTRFFRYKFIGNFRTWISQVVGSRTMMIDQRDSVVWRGLPSDALAQKRRYINALLHCIHTNRFHRNQLSVIAYYCFSITFYDLFVYRSGYLI